MKLLLVATGLLAKQYPFFQECAEGTFDDIAFEDFYASLKETKASLIRIDSDSLTYPLHIIIRYEIEKCYLGTFDDIAFEDFYASLKETKASLIRIDSDSLTYPLHIIIRYEIENIIIRYEIEKCYLMVLWKSLICQKCGTKIPRVLRRIT